MGFTHQEFKAIFAVAKRDGLKLRLCQKPWVYFKTADEREVRRRIADVVSQYEAVRRQDTRARRTLHLSLGPAQADRLLK